LRTLCEFREKEHKTDYVEYSAEGFGQNRLPRVTIYFQQKTKENKKQLHARHTLKSMYVPSVRQQFKLCGQKSIAHATISAYNYEF